MEFRKPWYISARLRLRGVNSEEREKEASIYLDKLLLKPKSFGSFPDNPVFSPSLLNFSVGGGKNSSNVSVKLLAWWGCKCWPFCDLRRNQKQISNILEASWLDWGFEVTSAIFVRCPARLSSKIVSIYVLFVCNSSSPKIWSCKNFDKFHVWIWSW